MWQLRLYCHVQPHAALELAETLSPSLALARQPVGSHSLDLALNMPFLLFEVVHWILLQVAPLPRGAGQQLRIQDFLKGCEMLARALGGHRTPLRCGVFVNTVYDCIGVFQCDVGEAPFAYKDRTRLEQALCLPKTNKALKPALSHQTCTW